MVWDERNKIKKKNRRQTHGKKTNHNSSTWRRESTSVLEETKQQLRERESVGAGRNKVGDNGGDEEGRERHGTQIKEIKEWVRRLKW